MRCLPLVIVLLLVLAPPASAMRWLDDPDTTPPVLTVPGPISVQTADPAGKVVHYDVSAADDTDPTPTILCDHDNDVMFTVGVTTITCTAQDASGNGSAPGVFTVTVELTDTTPPVLVAPSSVSQETEINADTSVVFSVSATDNVDGPVSVNCDHDSGSLFPIGTTTTVHCSATDSHGNIGDERAGAGCLPVRPIRDRQLGRITRCRLRSRLGESFLNRPDDGPLQCDRQPREHRQRAIRGDRRAGRSHRTHAPQRPVFVRCRD